MNHSQIRKLQQKEIESAREIRKLNRVYAVLSEINQSIVREKNIKSLLKNACRIAVDQGNFVMAWIGLLEAYTKRVDVVAKAGNYSRYFNKLNITLKDDIERNGPTTKSIISGKHSIVNDIKREESMILRRDYALKIGCRSMAAFPIKVNKKIIGNFNIYASSPDFFSDSELKLLDEVADDLSFAMEFSRKEKEKKQTEKALKEHERRLSSIYDTVGDVIFHLEVLKDGSYRFISVNNAFQKTTGLEFDQVVGKNVDEVIPEPSLTMVLGKYRKAIKEKRMMHWEETSIYPTGELIGEVSISPVFDNKGRCTHLVGAVHDITARKKAEQKIRLINAELELRVDERTAQLEDANKELEAFSYSVSHDLRAPLRSIIGFTNILQEESEGLLSDEAAKALNRIITNADRMNQLIDDLLEFSRMGRGDLNKINSDTTEMVKQILTQLLASETDRKIEINNFSLLPGKSDLNMIKQVWINLLSNALKYTRGKTTAKIEIGSRRQNGEIYYYVKDNGAGFDMKYYDKLFNVFQRLHTSHEFEGTGVGLAIVKRIIKRHGGRVWAESKTGAGATFYFSLPG